nr:hypothetical protein [Tanacetum cinerariifolium]
AHDALLEPTLSKPYEESSTQVPEGSGNPNPTASAFNPLAEQMETLIVESPIPTVSSPVPTACLNESSEPSTSLIPTLRIHKDHPKSQIIGPVDTPIQTRHKSKMVEEQSFMATVHQKTDPALLQFCLFSCFLSQGEPKKVSDALQDPSCVKAMQEELLQFKIQKDCSPFDTMLVHQGEGSSIPTEPHHTPFPEAQQEEIGRLKAWVQVLEDIDAIATKQSGEDAPIKGRSNNEGEAAAERISNDSEEIARVLTSMDAVTVLAGEIDVPNGSGFIPTVGPPATIISTSSEVGPTASPIVTRRKEQEMMQLVPVEDVYVQALQVKHPIIEWKIETTTKEFPEEKIKETMQLVPVKDVYVQALQVKHPIIEWKQLDREDLNQLWTLVKEYLSIKPATKWKLYDLSGVHHVTAKDKEIFMLVEKDYPLRRGLALVMISYKLQIEN